MSLRIIILSPVISIWDHSVFCSSVTKLCLAKRFQITLFYTLSLFSSNSLFSNSSAIEVLPSLIAKFKDRFQEPFVLVGFAMAGTLVQMLAAQLPNVRSVLAVNTPGYPDALLQQRLGYLLTLLEKGDLSGALETLDSLVQPIEAIKKRALSEIPDVQKSMAIERMTRGFKLLLGMDARNEIIKYTGNFLALVGEKSQLATVDNQTRSHNLGNQYKIIPGVGMRLWDDNPVMTNRILNEWINRL